MRHGTALRVSLVFAAIFAVAAVACGLLFPAGISLSQFIADGAPALIPRLQSLEISHLGTWAWQTVTLPLLVRPVWLLLLMCAIVCLGVVVSLSWVSPSGVGWRR